jgi:myo-inositol-1(or 4)-monophosphatase
MSGPPGSESESQASLARDLALALREQVLPSLGSHAGRAHAGAGEGGDVTFAIDEQAEAFLERYLAEHAPGVAFYSEDRGLVAPGDAAEWVLVVDPIDGTRPAMAGLESACVSVATARLGDGEPAMADVEAGCVVEIKSGAVFAGSRDGGVQPEARLSANADLARMFWTYGFRGRPAIPTATVLSELIDASSVGGGAFDLGSATFDMTRIVTGQLDAYVEPGPRIVADVPGMREEFERVGGGALLNNSPYDLAAAKLICERAGAIVTDAYGNPLDDRPLLGSGGDFQMSCVASASRELHDRILAALDRGIERLRALTNPV